MSADRGRRPMRVANCSGFFGDRLSAAREMVDGGPVDVLTGDWLAELTMLILWKQRNRNADAGYAATFLTQMEQVLGTCAERGIKVVSNAGGLNPAGCAERVREIADRLGVSVRVAHVEGDDLIDRIDGLRPHLTHLDTGAALTGEPVSANAYLGCWGIARALHEGADVVVTGRVTDASVVVGPAAWWWDWSPTDWDRLAGAVTAGHVIECGAQATGGNYAFFHEIPDLARPPGFPIAEIDADGSSVITKHPDTGGLVSVGTVTAQLLYEIGPPAYANPDVIARFDTIRLDDDGPDRVRVSGMRGEPAPAATKVCINLEGGYRNRMTFVLTGLDQEGKAEWVRRALFDGMGGESALLAAGTEIDVAFVPAPADAADGQESASGRLHVSVKSADERAVGRTFSSAAIELALANYPGFFATTAPGPAQSFGVYWPALVPADEVDHVVVLDDGRRIRIDPSPTGPPGPPVDPASRPAVAPADLPAGEPLGRWFGARSGDKGGNANVGVWATDDAGFAWLVEHLTTDRLRELIPEARDLEVRRHELADLRAVNFVLVGYLGEGVASSTAFDPQAKGLGEYLRSRPV
ncbi:MAG: acyclic terpene utilization AtuA family protein [Ilumatobacteraceae bacterium]